MVDPASPVVSPDHLRIEEPNRALNRRTERGMATEVFLLKNGQWLNTGWQLSPSAK